MDWRKRFRKFWHKWYPSAEPPLDREKALKQDVFPTELEYLGNRWEVTDTGHPKVEPTAAPASRNSLVGMALSGGGIRSAAFNLGILQALDRRGAFKHIDYLSTVSGGGFLGSSLTTLMSEPARRAGGARKAKFPFTQETGAVEPAEVQYLRNNSNYLATRGLLDYLRIAAVLVRGILLNFLVLVPLLLLGSMVVILFYGQGLLTRLEADDDERRIAVELELAGWVGTESDDGVGSLMQTLRQNSLIATYRGETRHDVMHALRGRGSRRLAPLVTGQGEDRELRFRRGVTDRQVVRRLRDSGALVELEAVEEVARIENRVDSVEGFSQGLGGRFVGDLLRAMDRLSIERPTWAMPKVVKGGLEKQTDELSLLAGDEKEVVLVLETAGLLEAFDPSEVKRSRRKFEKNVTLRQAIYELYIRAQFDPRWIEEEFQDFWSLEPPAYWELVELGLVRDGLEARLEAAVAAGEAFDRQPSPDILLPDPRSGAEPASPGGEPGPTAEPKSAAEPTPGGEPKAADPDDPAEAADREDPEDSIEPDEPSDLWLEKPCEDAMFRCTAEGDGDLEPEAELARLKGLVEALMSSGGGGRDFVQDERGGRTSAADREKELDAAARRLYYDAKIAGPWLGDRRREAYRPRVELLGRGKLLLAYDRYLDPLPQEVWDPHRFSLPWTARLALLGVIWVGLYPLLLWFGRLSRASWSRWLKRSLGCGLILGGGLVGLVAWIGLWIANLQPQTGDLLIGVGLAVAVFALLAYLRRRRSSLWWRDRLERSFSGILVAVAVAAFVELQPYLIYHFRSFEAGGFSWSISLGAVSLLVSMAAGPLLAVLKTAGRAVVLLLVALLGPLLPALIYVYVVNFSLYASRLFWEKSYVLDNSAILFVFLAVAALVHLLNLPLDINSTSLHGFYRDRLSRAFLIAPADKRGRVEEEDDLGLEEICQEGSGAPYHLINVALNMQGSDDPTVKRRKSDFFTFSRDFIGGPLTGYCETESMRQIFPNLYLSSATAVSAAAAAPNMGTFTFAPLVILMALLNVRLGFWLPNPARVSRWTDTTGKWPIRALRRLGRAAQGVTGAFRARPGAYFLLNEMLSRMHNQGPFVNLSDGGHIENTGAYELLRRRCRFIIVGDAEADPEMRFTGLANLIRYARIDLGIEIDLAVDDLELDEAGLSRRHAALGVIRYPAVGNLPHEAGYLLYLKSSVTGDEDEVIAEYGKRSKGFPHESTADQAFSEGQFEAYRGLGEHVADGLFEGTRALGDFKKFSEFSLWFQELRTALSPGRATGTPAPETEAELAAISRELRRPELVAYFYEIHPELKPAGFRTAAERARAAEDGDAERVDAEPSDAKPGDEAAGDREFLAAFQLASRQLQIMQSLFVQLELDRSGYRAHPGNRGWMNLFQSWARSPTFQRAYLRLITAGSGAFQEFCETALGLDLEFHWTAMQKKRLEDAVQGRGVGEGKQPVVGRLELRLAKQPGAARLRDRIHIGYLRLTPTEARIDLLPGYRGTGIKSRARIELRRWDEEHKIGLDKLPGVTAPTTREIQRL